MNVDLNCDMGESIGIEQDIMPYITSANIACGVHAGDEVSMRTTVRLAKQFGVAVGAHPSWPDRAGFGRREMSMPPEAVEALLREQMRALHDVAKTEGIELRHVKPHGALYNQAAQDRSLAQAIAQAVKRFNGNLVLVGLAGSQLIEAGLDARLRVASEGFADRRYQPDGSLVPRSQPNAVIDSPGEVAAHAVQLVQAGALAHGQSWRIDTLCLHGDHPHAARNARQVRAALEKAGVHILAL